MTGEAGIRVAQWSGSDVINYGDQLFPLISKQQLAARLPNLEMTCFAPTGNSALPPGGPPVFPLGLDNTPESAQRREYFARHFDAILIGGGDILRFDRVEPGYTFSEDRQVPRPYHPFLDFLWEYEKQPNVLWNCVGATSPFESTRRLLVRKACSHVGYMSVRDEVTRGYLLEAGVEGEIHVVPDTGILLAELIRSRVSEEKARELLASRGVGSDARGVLCFQCAPGFLRDGEKTVAQALRRVADEHDLEVVLLPVGLCHGDLDALRRVQVASGERFTLVEGIEGPLEIGAVIGACDYFVGSSLHGNLTALSFAIPHLIVNHPGRSAKLEGLAQLARLEDFRIAEWRDLNEALERLMVEPRGRWKETADGLKARVSQHFDHLAALISRAAENRREFDVPAKRKAGSLLTSQTSTETCRLIEALHQRAEDAEARVATLEKRDAQQSAALQRLENQRSEWRAKNEELRAKNRELRQKLDHMRRQVRELSLRRRLGRLLQRGRKLLARSRGS